MDNVLIDNLENTESIEVKVVEYVDGQPKRQHIYKGTYAQIFEKFEEENRHVRYCNGHWFSFEDPEIEKLRRFWYSKLSKSESIKLYYGNGTVD